jgi:hypothetical protein
MRHAVEQNRARDPSTRLLHCGHWHRLRYALRTCGFNVFPLENCLHFTLDKPNIERDTHNIRAATNRMENKMTTLSTTIDYCEGIHSATGLPMCKLTEIRTEELDQYSECPTEEQEAVQAADHRFEIAKAEAISRFNRGGHKGRELVERVLNEEGIYDRLFDAGREDADTFVREHDAATKLLSSLGYGELVYHVEIAGKVGAQGLTRDQAIADAYEHISRKYRDANTDECLQELELRGETRYDSLTVRIIADAL